jgi:hypothetical protein
MASRNNRRPSGWGSQAAVGELGLTFRLFSFARRCRTLRGRASTACLRRTGVSPAKSAICNRRGLLN